MRIMMTSVLLAILTSTLPAQIPVKKDLIAMIGQVPPPPASVRDAYAKTTAGDNLQRNADKVFESMDKETAAIEAEYKAHGRDVAVAATGMTPEMVKKSQDPELKKRMKKMSKEEKMKMAMEMMNSGALPRPVVVADPPPVRAALDEWMKVYAGLPAGHQASGSGMQEEMKLQEEYEKKHAEINDREGAEIAKLPQISSGEMSAPDPAQVKVVRLRAADQHIALANQRLTVIRSRWDALVEKTKSRYGVFYTKFMAADYGEDSSPPSRKTLADAQLMVFTDLGRIVSISRTAYEESARWMAHRVEIEQQ